jgi:ABC-type uncharacterized transport system substrate-binding protein
LRTQNAGKKLSACAASEPLCVGQCVPSRDATDWPSSSVRCPASAAARHVPRHLAPGARFGSPRATIDHSPVIPMKSVSRLTTRCARLAAAASLLAAQAVSAHPHVWIQYSAKVQMRGAAIVAVSETWRFTDGFPVQLVGIDSLPDNGPVGPAQTKIFREQAFQSLAGSGYFSHLFVDGKPQTFRDPGDFRVSVVGGKIQYAFTLTLAAPVTVTGHQVELGIWDDSFFVDYEPDSANAITLSGHPAASCTAKPFADRAHPIFGGIVIPQGTALSC